MRSTAHRGHTAMGATFERRGSWEVPGVYTSEEKETAALRSALGYADISARGKLHLSGTIDPLVHELAATSGCVVARVARDWALALTAAGAETKTMSALERLSGDEAMVTDMTSAMSGFLVAGPRLEAFLAQSVRVDLAELKPGASAALSWARIPAVLVVREADSPAVEIYVASDHGRYAWVTIGRLAGRLDGSPAGWRALESWGWK